MLEAFKHPLQQRRLAGEFFNVWSVAGLRRDEVRNAAVLASFLNFNKFGLLGRTFLSELVRQAVLRVPDFEVNDIDGYYSVMTEFCPLGNRGTRIDLIFEGRQFILGIEVKIDAPERPAQLDDYLEVLREKARPLKQKVGLIFLSPRPSGNCQSIVPHLTWGDVARAGEKAIRNKNVGDQSSWLLSQFCSHISGFR